MTTYFMYMIFTLVFYWCVFVMFFYDSKHWNGLENEKNEIFTKAMNRLYFITTSFSTCGYGDISPKTMVAKMVVSTMQCLLIFEVIHLVSSK